MSDIDISFITVNYGTPYLVNRLIESIRQFPPPMSYEIIVVDNNSFDDSVEIIGNANPDITLISLKKNIGFGGGNNRAAEVAKGRILVLFNSDGEIREETFGGPARYIEENQEVGIVGLQVMTPDGTLEQTARGFPNFSTGLVGRSTILGRLIQKFGKAGKSKGIIGRNLQVDPDKTEPYEVDWVAGTIKLIRKEVWDRLEGFDEGYFMYWEDADICKRAHNLGYRVIYYPGARIYHAAGSSTSRNPVPAIKWFHQSAYRYICKHISPGPSLLRGFAWLALNLRAGLKILIAGRKKPVKKDKSKQEK